MEKKNGGMSVRQEILFHGTTESVLYAICQQNFDHRLSGTRVGAKYGQGKYEMYQGTRNQVRPLKHSTI